MGWVFAPPNFRCENEREVPANSLDSGGLDFPYYLAADVFLQKKMLFARARACVCI